VRTAPDDPRQPQRDRLTRQDTNRGVQSQISLHKAKDLIGSDLHNRMGDKVGSIEHFIVEHGSGQLVFAIVEIGGVMGLGGNEFALPYERLNWSDADDRFVTDMTKEHAETQGEFFPDKWNDLHRTTWTQRLTGWRDHLRDDAATERAIMAATERTEMDEIGGLVVEINPEYERSGSDDLVVVIETQEGERREVILGPSWYVTGHDSAPLRGQTVVIKVRQHERHSYGWSAGERGNEMILRNELGRSAWNQGRDQSETDRNKETDRENRNDRGTDGTNRDRTNPNDPVTRNPNDPTRNQPATQPGSRPATQLGATLPGTAQPGDRTQRLDRHPDSTASNEPTRYILLSDLIDTDADARGISSSEIEGALIERRSGRVSFLLFDPNENFLEVGDTVSMVPWSVAYINRGMKVNLDADASTFIQRDGGPR
jgi:hypothetical protein